MGGALEPAHPRTPTSERDRHRLGLGEEIARVVAALAPDPGALRTTERGAQVTDEEAVDPDDPGLDLRRDAMGPRQVLGPDHRGKAVEAAVGGRDGLRLGRESVGEQHRPEDLLVPRATG